MAAGGVLAGAAFGFVLARLAGSYFPDVKMPGVLPVVLSAFVLLTAAVVASWLPAARAARVAARQGPRSARDAPGHPARPCQGVSAASRQCLRRRSERHPLPSPLLQASPRSASLEPGA